MAFMAGTDRIKLALAMVALTCVAIPSIADARGQKEGRPSFEELDTNSDGEITQEDLNARRDARFTEADANGDGQLSQEELQAQSKRDSERRHQNRAARMIERLDENGDKMITKDEIMAAKEKRKLPFDKLDKDGSGGISKEEFEKMKKHGKRHGRKDGRKGRHGDRDDD